MAVGVRIEEASEGLRRDEHRRYGLFELGRVLRSAAQAGASRILRVAS